MKKYLENLFTLNHKVTIYVPATKDINIPIDNTPYVERFAALFSDLFGGATSSPAIGYWSSPEAGLVKENTTIVFAFAESLDAIDQVVDAAAEMCAELSQDAVALEVDGRMAFIKKPH